MIHKSYILILAIFSICLFNLTYGDKLPCPAVDGYDISNLTKPNYWVLDMPNDICVESANTTCTFYFTFCNILPLGEGSCINSSVCQFNNDRVNSTIIELGHYEENPFSVKEINGFYASFEGKEIINKFTNKPCNVSIIFEFDCNKNVPWASVDVIAQAPAPTNYTSISADSCQYYMKFDYAGACHRIVPPTTTTDVNPSPSRLCIPPYGYNISILTQAPYWSFNIASGCAIESNLTDACTLYMSFCKPIESLIDCDGSSACIRYPNMPGSSIIVGNFTEDPFTAYEKDGFRTDYLPGVEVYNRFTQKNCQISISLKFDCDLDAVWEVPPVNTPGIGPDPLYFSSISNVSCQLQITVPYSGACPKQKKIDNGLSAGSILLIIFFVSVAVYLVVGSLYNLIVQKEKGSHVMPHYKFWASILLFSLEGFIFTWKFITCQTKKEKNLKYDSI